MNCSHQNGNRSHSPNLMKLSRGPSHVCWPPTRLQWVDLLKLLISRLIKLIEMVCWPVVPAKMGKCLNSHSHHAQLGKSTWRSHHHISLFSIICTAAEWWTVHAHLTARDFVRGRYFLSIHWTWPVAHLVYHISTTHDIDQHN